MPTIFAQNNKRNKMNTNSLAKRLKELRNLRGMSQEFLAEESRVSLRTIQRIENEESVPTGETIKRIAVALDVAMNELVESKSIAETNDIKGTLIFFKKLISKTNVKAEIHIFKKFIAILTHLKNKDLTQEQLELIESYIHYLELEKIPSYSNELFKKKLNKFRKHLKTKLRFVPSKYYTTYGIIFAVPFVIGFSTTNGLSLTTKIAIVSPVLLLIAIGLYLDSRIKKQGRALDF